MAVYEGKWDCPVCGHIGNRGPDTKCINCGSPRDSKVEFYLSDKNTVVTDEKKLKEAQAGVNWNCDYCAADNVATATKCHSCGNDRTVEDVNRVEKDYQMGEKNQKNAENKKEINNQNLTNQTVSPVNYKEAKKGWKKAVIIVSSAILLLIILFWPWGKSLEITSFAWERTIDIEDYAPRTESGWSVPSGGTTLSSSEKIHHYDKVYDHTETKTRTVQVKTGSRKYVCGTVNKGNGYFEDKYCEEGVYESKQESYEEKIYRDEPVYRTYYNYSIYRWAFAKREKSSGTDKKPFWPVNTVSGQTREGKKREYYYIFVKNDQKPLKDAVSFHFWSKKNVGDKVKVKFNIMGMFYGITED